MISEQEKLINGWHDYICLACGTYNCNEGICRNCDSVQFGSARYRREEQRRREAAMTKEERLAAKKEQEAEKALLAQEQHAQREIADRKYAQRLAHQKGIFKFVLSVYLMLASVALWMGPIQGGSTFLETILFILCAAGVGYVFVRMGSELLQDFLGV